jgi:O-antigen ligase/tetratricopeptide (TPR) repeat protein
MKKTTVNLPYHYLFIIIPLIIIPFIQTKALLDISLNIRFLALNICLLFGATFFMLTQRLIKAAVNQFIVIYFIYVLYSILSGIISANPPDALFQFAVIADFGILTFLFYAIFSSYPFQTKYIALIFNLLGLVIITLALIDYVDILTTVGISHQSIYNITATFSHKNILSEVLFVVFPFSMYSLFSKRRWVKALGAVNCVGILFLIITLLTRAVWLSVVLGFGITFIIFILISEKETLKMLFRNRKTYLFMFSIVAIIASSLVIYSRTDSFETIAKSSQKIFKAYDSSQHRIELWKRTLEIAKENPVLGKGLATWKIEVLKYGNRGLQSEDNVTFYQRPHNDFLWVLSEQGIIGLVLFLSIFVVIIYYLVKLIKRAQSTDERLFYCALCYLIIGYMIFSFFSFPRERIEHQLFLGIVMALISAKFSTSEEVEKSAYLGKNQVFLGAITIGIFLVFSTGFALSRFRSELHLKKAFDARSQNDWNRVMQEIDESKSPFYQMDPFSTPILWYSGEANFVQGNIEGAFKDYLQCYKINPYHYHVLNNLATCYELKGNHSKAIELYNEAINIAPKFEDALLNLTAVYYNTGDFDRAFSTIDCVDSTSKNEKYIPYLEVVLKSRIEQLKNRSNDHLLIELFIKIQENNQLMTIIFMKSKQNNITFDKQLYLDCLYILKDVDKSIDKNEYNKLKNKYINPKQKKS